MNYIKQIDLLRKELAKELPGKSFQNKMVPPGRNSRHFFKVEGQHPQKAGILILLFPFQDELCTALIKRTENNGPHSGQISFPGGKVEKGDRNLEHTALRETAEELGVNSENIKLLGALTPLFIPVSNFEVYPFIGFINNYKGFTTQADEVQYAILEKIKDFYKPGRISSIEIKQNTYSINVPCYKIKDADIWGATAMILSEFLEVYRKAFNSGK